MRTAALLALLLSIAGSAIAQKAPFDLQGPSLTIQVGRGFQTLPIGEVPALAPGDRLSVRADFPNDQSVRYVLVAAFLREATDPPPKSWFTAAPAWDARHGELRATVPQGARQALVFLVPHTGGDIGTLVGAIRARPGAFLRAAQDLEQLDLDRARLIAFVAGVQAAAREDPASLKAVSANLSRVLSVKADPACFDRPMALQAACLLKDQDALVLDDGHEASLAERVTAGPQADLIGQISVAAPAGGGLYSPYVGAVMDLARILGGLRTPHFQYIPALAVDADNRLDLKLNAPPSFGAAKSVLVVGLRAVGPAPQPILRASDPGPVSCLAGPAPILPVEGAPEVFATGFAHDLRLRVQAPSVSATLPVEAAPRRGGLQVAGAIPTRLGGSAIGVVQGRWGFEPFEGPVFELQSAADGGWRTAGAEAPPVVANVKAEPLRLQGGPAACVTGVALQTAEGASRPAAIRVVDGRTLEVEAPAEGLAPGPAEWVVSLEGGARQSLATEVVAKPARLGPLDYHAGDETARLEGHVEGKVASVTLAGARFTPAPEAPEDGAEGLALRAASAPAVEPGRRLSARIAFADGRSQTLAVQVLPPRPKVSLTARALTPLADGAGPRIALGRPDDVPAGARLTLSLHAAGGEGFDPADVAEVRCGDDACAADLGAKDGLTLIDRRAAIAVLDTAKAFGPSAWGPLRLRIADARGKSDWLEVGRLVRLPRIDTLTCAPGAASCTLAGDKLFLIAAVSADPAFVNPQEAPDGYPGAALSVPRPHDGRLFVRLHDDPQAVAEIDFGPARQARTPAPASPEAVAQRR